MFFFKKMARPRIIKTAFGQRLTEARGSLDRIALAEITGTSDRTIGNYERGERSPDAKFLAKLSTSLGVNLNWLINGVGPKKYIASSSGQELQPPGDLGGLFRLVPKLSIEASAGAGALSENEDPIGSLSFRRDWLRWRGINPNSAASLTVRGDSMEPTIRDGDTLLLDTSIDHVKDNGIYVVVFDGMVVVKRVHLSRDGSVTLISDNQLYPPEKIPLGEVPEVSFAGRVMWFGRSI